MHLGKGLIFRKNGIPIPEKSEEKDIIRLANAVISTSAECLWVLGDLFHSVVEFDDEYEKKLKKEISKIASLCYLKLILGNHDRGGALIAKKLGFRIYWHDVIWNSICLSHHPKEKPDKSFRICGHLHPQISFDNKIDRLTFPCFAILRRNQLCLPAFTEFSGGCNLSMTDADCFPITPMGVLLPKNRDPST